MSLMPTIVNWYGGKQRLARQIISVMPEHEHYVEVFMGGAAVFFNKPKSPNNTLNDFNSNLVNLFIQVRDNFEAFAEKCYWTLYSRQEYKSFYKKYQDGFKDVDDVTRAMMYLFLVRANFNSRIGLGFSSSIDCNSASFNLALIERMKLAREKLTNVVIENRDCIEIIKKFDVPHALLYLDPPYYVTIHEKSYYEKTMTLRQHESLAFHLSRCKAPWILSYDDLPEVVDLYKEFRIQRIGVKYSLGASRDIRVKKGDRVRKISELLITNFKAKHPQLDAFDENDVDTEEVTDEEKIETEITLKKEREIAESLKPKESYVIKPSPSAGEQTDLFSS